MNIITDIIEINNFLNEYNGNQANLWLFDISHVKLAIKIYSTEKEDIIYLVMAGCKYIKGSFSLYNPSFFVTQYVDNENSEILFKIVDENSDFELTATSGIALAQGLDSEFGISFDDFLL